MTLQRTADRKFLRLDIDARRATWPAGSRRRARSCTPTAASSLGSIEAGAFTPDQLQHDRRLRQPARRRPAGAGRAPRVRRGRLRGHAVAEALPVQLDVTPGRPTRSSQTLTVQPDAARPDARRHADCRHRAGCRRSAGRRCRR
ncbi:MAG: hypothetical protein MZU95_01320 [Desulfomicrobium escambiense]|nr:hypothetical protein [Desulfomicrobium escambiense]